MTDGEFGDAELEFECPTCEAGYYTEAAAQGCCVGNVAASLMKNRE